MSLRRFMGWSLAAVIILTLSGATVNADPLPAASKDALRTSTQILPASLPEGSVRATPSAHPGTSAPSIPEPATVLLVGIALLSAGTMVRRRKTGEI